MPTSAHLSRRVTSWLPVNANETPWMISHLPSGLLARRPSGGSYCHPVLNSRALSPKFLIPVSLPPNIEHVKESTDLILHPTLAKVPRPRYVIVRGQVYFPPRSALDSMDNYFEPAVKEPIVFCCVVQPSTDPLVVEDRLRTLALLVTMLNCLGITVAFICGARRWIFGE